MKYNSSISCRVCFLVFPGKRRGCSCSKGIHHEWWIYLKRTQYYVIKTFVIRQNTANDVCYTYYHKVRAWPSLPIMNSIQDTSRFPKKPEMARFSVLWFGSCIQLMSNKSQTLATQPHQWSFVCLLFEGRQTRGFLIRPLIHHSTLCNCFVFCLVTDSKTAQCQCVLSHNNS